MEKGSKVRKSNLELLRIIAMFMVVTLHFMLHGGILSNSNGHNFILSNILESTSIYAVDIYILISAYFMCDSKFKLNKVIKIWTQVFFYTVTIYIALYALGMVNFSMKDVISVIFPIISSQYSFVTTYIIILFASPFLNIFINSMSKKQYEKLLVFIVIIYGLLGTGLPISRNIKNYFATFTILYFIAGYLKKHIHNEYDNRFNIRLYLLCVIGTYVGRISFISCGIGNYAIGFLNYNFIFVILGSVGIFMYFKNIKIQSNIINKISSCTFGIYLIHDNNYIRHILYTKIFNMQDIYYNDWLIPITLVYIVCTFVICMLIEYIRNVLFEKIPINSLLQKYLLKIYTNLSKQITKHNKLVLS